MKRDLFWLCIVLIAFVACTNFDEELQPQPQTETPSDEYFQTRAVTNAYNPYSLSNMQQALVQVSKLNGISPIPLQPTHRYVKFNLADTIAYSILSDSLCISLYKYPLDHPLESGEMDYYFNKKTDWYYAVVPAGFDLECGIPYELLDNLYMQNKTATSGPLSSSNHAWLNETLWEETLKQSMKNAGIAVHEGASSTSSEIYPSVRVRYVDDRFSEPFLLPGVKVIVRHLTNEGWKYTDKDGIARDIAANTGKWFTDDVNVILRFENDQTEYWKIRDGARDVAEYHYPTTVTRTLDCIIDGHQSNNREKEKASMFAALHLAVYTFMNGQNALTKSFPNLDHKIFIAAFHNDYDHSHPYAAGWFDRTERKKNDNKRNDIRIFGASSDGRVMRSICLSNLFHELGHASHWQRVIDTKGSDRKKHFVKAESKMVESYANSVQYFMNTRLFSQDHALQLFRHDNADYTKVGASLMINGMYMELLQRAVVKSCTWGEWKDNIWAMRNDYACKIDRTVFDMIFDNPMTVFLSDYNHMLNGRDNAWLNVEEEFRLNGGFISKVEVLSWEISGTGYTKRENANKTYCWLTFSTLGKRMLTLTVRDLETDRILKASKEINVTQAPYIVAGANSSTKPRIGVQNFYKIKNITSSEKPAWSIGRYENNRFVDCSSDFLIDSTKNSPAYNHYLYIIPKYSGQYVIKAKYLHGIGKFMDCELEINVPNDYITFSPPLPNSKPTFLKLQCAYIKNEGTDNKYIYYPGAFYPINGQYSDKTCSFYSFSNLPLSDHPHYIYLIPLYANKFFNGTTAYDTTLYTDWNNTPQNPPIHCYISNTMLLGMVPLYSIEEKKFSSNGWIYCFRYLSTANKTGNKYTYFDTSTGLTYTVQTTNRGKIGYVYPYSDL